MVGGPHTTGRGDVVAVRLISNGLLQLEVGVGLVYRKRGVGDTGPVIDAHDELDALRDGLQIAFGVGARKPVEVDGGDVSRVCRPERDGARRVARLHLDHGPEGRRGRVLRLRVARIEASEHALSIAKNHQVRVLRLGHAGPEVDGQRGARAGVRTPARREPLFVADVLRAEVEGAVREGRVLEVDGRVDPDAALEVILQVVALCAWASAFCHGQL